MICQSRGSILVLIFISIVLFHSCKSDEDTRYIGSWRSINREENGEIVYMTIRTLILTTSTYEETYHIRRDDSGVTVGILGMKGRLSFSRHYMIFSLEELGACARDEMDKCTDKVDWFSEGSVYWDLNIPYFSKIVRGEYEVDGNNLILKRDLNNDGDYGDTGESVIFQHL